MKVSPAEYSFDEDEEEDKPKEEKKKGAEKETP